MPARPFGRSLVDFGTLGDAEQKLLESCRAGDLCVIATDRPKADGKTAANTVRAGFFRFLILGGDDENPVQEQGVGIRGAWIEGQLDLSGVTSNGRVCAYECWFDACPNVQDAHIKGALALSGSWLPGLLGDRLSCDAGLFFRDNFCSMYTIRLPNAKIGGNLACDTAEFNGPFDDDGRPSGDALIADGMAVRGSVFFNAGFKANGEVRLIEAKIEGSLNFDAANLNAPRTSKSEYGDALSADRMNVKGAVSFNRGFTSNGTVRLLNSIIGANLECRGATFNGPLIGGTPYGDALIADGINVKHEVFLCDKFNAYGEVSLNGAVIGGNLSCQGAAFHKAAEFTFVGEGMSISGTFFFRELKPPAGSVRLAHARMRVLADDKSAWGDNLDLDGFTYERLGGPSPKDAKTRLEWLDKQRPEWSGKNGKPDRFSPQPWLQLRKALRDAGQAEDARKVGIAFERRRRYCGQIKGFVPRIFHRIYGLFTGYGYRPMRLFYWSLGVWLVCGIAYDFAAYQNVFAPTDSGAYDHRGDAATGSIESRSGPPVKWVFLPPISGHYPTFHPFAYSLNVFLPVVDLGQEAAWAPSEEPFSPVLFWTLYHLFTDFSGIVQMLIWLETLFGWFAGLLLVAVVSGLARKQDES